MPVEYNGAVQCRMVYTAKATHALSMLDYEAIVCLGSNNPPNPRFCVSRHSPFWLIRVETLSLVLTCSYIPACLYFTSECHECRATMLFSAGINLECDLPACQFT